VFATQNDQQKFSFEDFKTFKIVKGLIYPSFEAKYFDMQSIAIQIQIFEIGMFIGIANAYYKDRRGLLTQEVVRVPLDPKWLAQVQSGTFLVGFDVETYYLYYVPFNSVGDILELPFFTVLNSTMLHLNSTL
jgi:hypothetical protein